MTTFFWCLSALINADAYSMNTNHESVGTHTVQGGLLLVHKSAPVREKPMLCPPAFCFPLINEDLPARATAVPQFIDPVFAKTNETDWVYKFGH